MNKHYQDFLEYLETTNTAIWASLDYVYRKLSLLLFALSVYYYDDKKKIRK